MCDLVSILIPAYNAERCLPATIRSALAQTWPHIEVIVVDDGSRDGTLAVASAFQSASVKVLSQPNMGAAAARNKALQLAQGRYIQWLDADDLLSPDKVRKQMQIAEQRSDPRVLLSSPWAYFMYRANVAKFAPTPLWCDLRPLDWIVRKWNHNLHMQTATWLVSRELSTEAGPWNTELLGDDDGEYFTRVVLASHEVSFVRDARVFYRVVGGSRLSYIGHSDRKLEAQFHSMALQIDYVRRADDGPSVRAAILSYLQTWLYFFHPERPDLVEEMKGLARSAGGELSIPEMPGPYGWIDKALGRVAAKRVQMHYNMGKSMALRSFDRFMHALVRPFE